MYKKIPVVTCSWHKLGNFLLKPSRVAVTQAHVKFLITGPNYDRELSTILSK